METRIYQLETTNRCNAKCKYCPHSKMRRLKGDVSYNTVSKVYDYCKRIGQDYIALHHMGEPLLHPNIISIISLFESANIHTEISTNGLLISKFGALLLHSRITRIRIAVDYFYSDKDYLQSIDNFLKLAKKYKTEVRVHTIEGNDLSMLLKHSSDNIIIEQKTFDNWAGAIEATSQLDKSEECYFKKYNYVVVLWDGRIVPCCMDYDGNHIIGHVYNLDKVNFSDNYDICLGCSNLQFAKDGGWKL